MENIDLNVPKDIEEEISKKISSDTVVGIDARQTHIIIIHKLIEIEKRLKMLEEKMDQDLN